MRKKLAAAVAVMAFVGPMAMSSSAWADPARPAGFPVAPSANGGDNGWGNCGHNSSGGNAHSGTQGQGGGNGGYSKDDCSTGSGGGIGIS